MTLRPCVRVVFAAWALAATGSAAAGQDPHLEVRLRLEAASRALTAEATVHVVGGGETAFTLAPRFSVTALRIDGRTVFSDVVSDAREDTRVVDLGPYATHRIRVSYTGTLAPLPGDGRAPDRDEPVAGPAGSYLPAASGWYPRFGHGLFTYRVALEVPAAERAVVPGRLVAESVSPAAYRAVFVSEAPSRDIPLLAGPYTIEERKEGGVRLRTYFHPDIAALAGDYLDSAADDVERYRRRIGAYPFSAFSVVSAPLPVGLGFPGLAYIGSRVLRLPFIRHTSLRHEVLHSWWGNGVYVDHGTGNWAEGLTTFMADYAAAEERGTAAAREMRLGWLRDYAALPAARDRPAVTFVTKVHDAAQVIGYNKVAFFFHMLRARIGAADFDDGVRRLWRRFRFRTAAWSDLARAFEDASGRDLGAFFDQWLRRAGAPELRLEDAGAQTDGARHRVSFTLAQASPPYALEVPIRITTAAGVQRVTVRLDVMRSWYRLAAEARPLALAVDPDFEVFRRLDAAETPPILRDVTLDGEAATLVLAGDERTRTAARVLAARLLDRPPRFAAPAPANLPDSLLVIGAEDRVGTFLAEAGLPPVPPGLAGRGTARIWAGRHRGRRLLVVTADNGAAIEALHRPLPHYGRQGYLIFEGSKALLHGAWPAGAGPLSVRLD